MEFRFKTTELGCTVQHELIAKPRGWPHGNSSNRIGLPTLFEQEVEAEAETKDNDDSEGDIKVYK